MSSNSITDPRRVLIISPCATHPPDAGNRQRLLNLAATLRELGLVPVLLYTDLLAGDVAEMRAYWGEHFHFHPYRPGSVAWCLKRLGRSWLPFGSSRRRWLAAFLRSRKSTPDGLLADVPVDSYYEPTLDPLIETLHQRHRFQAVIAYHALMSRALLRFGPQVKKVVDTVEVFALGGIKQSTSAGNLWVRISPEEELSALRRADVVLAIQDHDAATIRAAGHANVVTFGHPVVVEADAPAEAALRSRKLLFVAAGHVFDLDGLHWFTTEVYPLLAAWLRPEEVIIAGGIRDALTERPPFTFLGRVPDLAEVYRTARVVMAPLRQGTGLKIKVIEALGRGKALVATSFGARGVEAGTGTALTLADSPREFADAIHRVMHDDAECRRLMTGALAFAQAWNAHQTNALREALDGQAKSPASPCDT
jgi:glycosyltransferase involved in cell wall biosynthesis